MPPVSRFGPLLVSRVPGPRCSQPSGNDERGGSSGSPSTSGSSEASAALAAACFETSLDPAASVTSVGGDEDGACPICCTSMSNCELLRTICGHLFHEGCLEKWLHRNPTCPVCRRCLRGGPFAV
mmetsp:Transcript_61819/g.177936  ORF Transcript_61819/g.177936 Transcript_61819/m.177936 type:complete len:125 (+) Transcript_61819:236-610(+)